MNFFPSLRLFVRVMDLCWLACSRVTGSLRTDVDIRQTNHKEIWLLSCESLKAVHAAELLQMQSDHSRRSPRRQQQILSVTCFTLTSSLQQLGQSLVLVTHLPDLCLRPPTASELYKVPWRCPDWWGNISDQWLSVNRFQSVTQYNLLNSDLLLMHLKSFRSRMVED